jgi:ABC-type multidrug transport system fused ATPase/permease subunit
MRGALADHSAYLFCIFRPESNWPISGVVMSPLCAIAIVMLCSGALGGLVNYFLSDQSDEKQLNCWQHIFVGVVAAFIVPLFLNMASGDLIDKIRGVDGKLPDYSKLFVLAGFCLVAAASSRAFIQSISQRVLQEARSANKMAEAAREDAAEAKAAVAPFVEEEALDEQENSPKLHEGTQLAELGPDEKLVLKAMATGNYSLRSITGIAKDSGLTRAAVNAAVTSMLVKKYVVQSPGSSGHPRWYLSSAGRVLAADC